jgi:hypothetical protein
MKNVKIKKIISTGAFVAFSMVSIFVPTKPVFAAQTNLVNETFTNATTTSNDWLSGGLGSSTACLTAGTAATPTDGSSIPACNPLTGDANGSGTLRLTSAAVGGAGAVILDKPINLDSGLDIKFDMYQYGGIKGGAYNTTGDGIAFVLMDGSVTAALPNSSGASLGYTNINGGWAGVGFDFYGNFARATGANSGTPADEMALTQNAVTVRGDQVGGYAVASPTIHAIAPLSIGMQDIAQTRANAKRTVHITINSAKIMTVTITTDGETQNIFGEAGVNLNTINSSEVPDMLKIGFLASTGNATDIHEIQNLSVAQLAPNLSIVKTITDKPGVITIGTPLTYNLRIANAAAAGSTVGDVTVVDNIPDSLTIGTLPSGCASIGQKVTCTITDNSTNETISPALAAGATKDFAIPVTVNVIGEIENSATVFGGGDQVCQTVDDATKTDCKSSVMITAIKEPPAVPPVSEPEVIPDIPSAGVGAILKNPLTILAFGIAAAVAVRVVWTIKFAKK